MKLKNLVGLSLIIFGSCLSMMLFVGFALTANPKTAAAVDPATGLPMAASDASAGIVADQSGLNVSAPTPTPAAVAATTPTPVPVSAGATPVPVGAKTPVPTVVKTPVATPVPTPVAVVYCANVKPCYNNNDLKAGHCWGFIGTKIINLTGFATAGGHSGGKGVVTSSCGLNVDAILKGSITSGDGSRRTHNNVGADESALILSYLVQGAYDPNKKP